MFRPNLVRMLLVGLSVAAILGAMPSPGRAVPVADGNWGIAKGENVVTLHDTPLKQQDSVLATLPGGTEFTVGDVSDNFVQATVQQSGQNVSGWVYAKHLRTPSSLRRLAELGQAYTGYRLWTGAAPSSAPAAVSILRGGRPKPLPQFSIGANGAVTQVWPAGQPTEAQYAQAASLLGQSLQTHIINRGWFTVQSDADWVLMIVCGDLRTHADGGSLRVFQYGDLYLLDPKQKRLFFHRAIAGEGSTDEAIQDDFARQAASEYAEIIAAIWPAPAAVTPVVVTPVVTDPVVPPTIIVDPVVPILPPKPDPILIVPPKPIVPIVPIIPGPGPMPGPGIVPILPGPGPIPGPGIVPILPGPGPIKVMPGPIGPGPGKIGPGPIGPGPFGPGPGKIGPGPFGPGPGKIGPGPGKMGPPF